MFVNCTRPGFEPLTSELTYTCANHTSPTAIHAPAPPILSMEPEPESIAQEDGEISSSSDEEASLCSLSEGEEDPDKVEVDILSRLGEYY